MSLIEDLEKKLEGGKFRLLNEKLYKNKELTSEEADEYHRYYNSQISKWPADPKKAVIEKLKKINTSSFKIADLGCGSGEIAKSLPNVTSFDKYPINETVIKSETSKIPVADSEFDLSICCLSLMMTNIAKELKEINRILKIEGIFYMAEVVSRIKNMKKFINGVEKFGFKLKEFDKTNKFFIILSFVKKSDFTSDKRRLPSVFLNEWKYKKR